MDVVVDGGIRRGSEVVKALALGAKAVLAGRALVYDLACAGEAGAHQVLDILRNGIRETLYGIGRSSVHDLERGDLMVLDRDFFVPPVLRPRTRRAHAHPQDPPTSVSRSRRMPDLPSLLPRRSPRADSPRHVEPVVHLGPRPWCGIARRLLRPPRRMEPGVRPCLGGPKRTLEIMETGDVFGTRHARGERMRDGIGKAIAATTEEDVDRALECVCAALGTAMG